MRTLGLSFAITRQDGCQHSEGDSPECRSYALTFLSELLLYISMCGNEVKSIEGYPQQIDRARRMMTTAPLTETLLLSAQMTLSKVRYSRLVPLRHVGQGTKFEKLFYEFEGDQTDLAGLHVDMGVLAALLHSFESTHVQTICAHCGH